jgi:hypothetical protein
MHNIHFTEKKGDLEFRDCKGHINCNPHSQATQLTTIKMRIYQVRYTCYLMKKKYHTVGTFSILKRKIVEIDKFDIPDTQIHDRSLS